MKITKQNQAELLTHSALVEVKEARLTGPVVFLKIYYSNILRTDHKSIH